MRKTTTTETRAISAHWVRVSRSSCGSRRAREAPARANSSAPTRISISRTLSPASHPIQLPPNARPASQKGRPRLRWEQHACQSCREPLGLAGDEEDAAGAMAVDEALEGGAVQEQRRRVGLPGAVLPIALAAVQDMERAAGVEAQAVVGLIETVDDDQVPGLPVAIDQGRQPVRGDVVLERPEAAMQAAQAEHHR